MTKTEKITDAIEQCIPEIEKVTAGVVQSIRERRPIDLSGRGDFWSTWCSGRKANALQHSVYHRRW